MKRHATRKGRQPLGSYEIVVDGTDGAGKTSCVEFLTAHLEAHGHRVASHAPYRQVEVYPLWEASPEQASHMIVEVMNRFRATHAEADVLLWDRGWPTAFVSTGHRSARDLFAPFPPLTVLLLNTILRTQAKAQALITAGVWLTDPVLVRRYHTAYHELQAPPAPASLLRYVSDAESRFDFNGIGAIVDSRLEALDPPC